MKADKQQEKDNFLKVLSAMSPDELNTLIKEKGKKPKLVKPIIRFTQNSN